jgi:DNA-binding SARP family transcriptional activator
MHVQPQAHPQLQPLPLCLQPCNSAAEETAMATLEIRLLGALSVQRDGVALPRFPSRRAGDLLCYLLLARGALCPREQLAGLFWGDHAEARARHCLNTALWRLQRVLGPADSAGRPYLRVAPRALGVNLDSDTWLDVAEFEARCQLAERVAVDAPARAAALYAEAVELYTGDLLPDCYDDWALVERERLQRLYLRALARLLDWHAARGEHDAALDYGGRILARDPLREEVQRDVISVLLAAGQPHAALRHYRACETILRRELGVEPMPETQALLRRILGESALPPARPADLVEAIARLRDASAVFDHARARLQQAVELVERLMQATVVDVDVDAHDDVTGYGLLAHDAPHTEPSGAQRATHGPVLARHHP